MEHNELEEMRKQMELLNQKLDKEEFISDNAICEITKKKMNKTQRISIFNLITIIITLPFLIWDCSTTIGTIFWIIWGLAGLFEYLTLAIGLRNFKKKCDSVAKSIETIKKTKKLSEIAGNIQKFSFYSFLLLAIVSVIFRKVSSLRGTDDPEIIINVMAGIAFFIMALLFIGSIVYVFHEIGKNDELDNIFDQILEELHEPCDTLADSEDTIIDAETGKQDIPAEH